MDGLIRRHTKPGTAPGTLAGRAPVPDEALDFTLVEYTQEDCQILHNVEVDECRFHLGTPGRTWIDVAGRPSSEMLRDLGMAFNLHPLALEDVFHGNQRAKLDLYEGQGFIVLSDPVYEGGELTMRQVSIFFGENYVVSFHDHKQDIFKPGGGVREEKPAEPVKPTSLSWSSLSASRCWVTASDCASTRHRIGATLLVTITSPRGPSARSGRQPAYSG